MSALSSVETPASTTSATRPAHVPQSLVMDFNCYELTIPDEDVAAYWLDLKANAPAKLFWTDHNGGHWVLLDGIDVRRVYSDYATFSNAHIVVPPYGTAEDAVIPLEMDPPESLLYRKVVVAPLMPGRIADLVETARRLTIDIVEEIKPKGRCEFVKDFGTVLPILVFLALMDLPEEDREMLLPLAEKVTRPKTPEERAEGHAALRHYLMGYVATRRATPGDDLISRIATAQIGGEPIQMEKALQFALLVLLGGLDTVANVISYIFLFLARNPTHRRQLIDEPELLPAAIDECLRRFGMVADCRLVVQDTVLSGVTLKAGDMVMAPTWMYGVDESVVPNPLKVDFQRPNHAHVSFGYGPHVCAGMHLAKRELRIFVQEWLARIPNFEVQPGAQLRVETGIVQGLAALPLVWGI